MTSKVDIMHCEAKNVIPGWINIKVALAPCHVLVLRGCKDSLKTKLNLNNPAIRIASN